MNQTTVYVVDPDTGILDALRVFLESFEVPVETFVESQQFLQMAGTGTTGCVLVEVQLSGVNGFGLMQQARARSIDIPFVVLSFDGSEVFCRHALRAGAVAVLQKPLANNQLIGILIDLFGPQFPGLREAISRREVLLDGTEVTIRPMQPSDRVIEQTFVRGLSNRSKYRRFFTTFPELPAAMLDRFIQIQYPDNLAYIALSEMDSVETIVGVARYNRTEAGVAEFAIVVADRWHGRGVGTLLLARLLECSATAGIKRMVGVALRENRGIQQLAREAGFRVTIDPDDVSLVNLERSLGDCT